MCLFQIMIFSRYIPISGIAESYGSSIFSFLRMQEVSLFFTPSPAFIACRRFDDYCSDWCEVIPYCSFDLHFSNDQ